MAAAFGGVVGRGVGVGVAVGHVGHVVHLVDVVVVVLVLVVVVVVVVVVGGAQVVQVRVERVERVERVGADRVVVAAGDVIRRLLSLVGSITLASNGDTRWCWSPVSWAHVAFFEPSVSFAYVAFFEPCGLEQTKSRLTWGAILASTGCCCCCCCCCWK